MPQIAMEAVVPTVNLNAILVGLAYAALTGIVNAVFSHKSQIEAYATANPRLAAIGKLLRAIGFDPQNFWAFLTLMFAKVLPAAQRADSPVAVREEVKAEAQAAAKAVSDAVDETVRIIPPPSKRPDPPFPPAAALLLLAFAAHSQACANWKPAARTANDIAGELCTVFFSEQKPGMSAADVARQFCTTQADLRPWLDQVLAAKQSAGKVALSRKVAP